ncbi:unnamed protein product [Mytilus coruscus]|uniref:Integrase catalytic domain-containing protein n=1 Tax=Mytilus coruscus TaxID=42192 RepID=A0A6J8A4J0_MYTCO|nr:unnamed protein product [Mytilus coruscus]
MISDNASTCKSSAAEISQIFKSETVHGKLSGFGTVWKFIPNRVPWYGGWWERLIRHTKTSLKKILGRARIDLDMLHTVVECTDIEFTLNNRPLTYICTDEKDPKPLTPSHLLYGRRLKTLPYPSNDQSELKDSRKTLYCAYVLKRNKQQQELLQHFRTGWKKEYLTSLREFYRASGNNLQRIKTGDS